jgi:hypothetical protein
MAARLSPEEKPLKEFRVFLVLADSRLLRWKIASNLGKFSGISDV